MDAEQIVRALDREDAPIERDDPECLFCGATDVYDATRDALLHVDLVEGHDPTCPWRLAREWVAAN